MSWMESSFQSKGVQTSALNSIKWYRFMKEHISLCAIAASFLPEPQLPTFIMATSSFFYPFLLKNASSCTPWMACWRFCLFRYWLTACSVLFLFLLHYLGSMFSDLIYLPMSVSVFDLFLRCCVAVKCSPAIPVSICGFCNALVHAYPVAP